MRIAVLGSWRDQDRAEWHLEDGDSFRDAAAAIGAELARLGHVLVVGSDGEDTADYHAVRGALSIANAGRPPALRVHILGPNNRAGMFRNLRRQHPGLFSEGFVPASDWAPAKVFQIKESHGVVIIAGARASLQAGLTTAVTGKRLVCVGGFGGAARQLNQLFMGSRLHWGPGLPEAEALGTLQSPWTEDLVPSVIGQLGAANKPRLLIVHGRSEDRWRLKDHLHAALALPEPLIMAERITPGEVLPVKFEALAAQVDGAVALVTPDDIGALAHGLEAPGPAEQRARQNVWIEIGWFWGRLGRSRVLILTRGQVSIPSDLHGVETYEYTEDPAERAREIQAFAQQLGRGVSPVSG